MPMPMHRVRSPVVPSFCIVSPVSFSAVSRRRLRDNIRVSSSSASVLLQDVAGILPMSTQGFREVVVDPTFVHTYVAALCKGLDPLEANRCVASIVVPPIEDQELVMDALRRTFSIVDVRPILGPCMHLLAQGKMEEYNELVGAYVELVSVLEHVQRLVEAAVPPFDPGLAQL